MWVNDKGANFLGKSGGAGGTHYISPGIIYRVRKGNASIPQYKVDLICEIQKGNWSFEFGVGKKEGKPIWAKILGEISI